MGGERERGRWLTTNIEVQVPWSRFTRHLEQGFDHSNLVHEPKLFLDLEGFIIGSQIDVKYRS